MSAETVPEVTAEEGRRLVEEGALLLDVREADEWDAGHAPAAVWIPLGEISARASELPRERRSSPSAAPGRARSRSPSALIDAGYDAVNLEGGMRAWVAEDYEIVAGDGLPGTVI